MVTFYCDACGALVFFESVTCVSCGRALGFLPDVMSMTALERPATPGRAWRTALRGSCTGPAPNGLDYGVCNWYVPVEETEGLCAACRLNEMIPRHERAGQPRALGIERRSPSAGSSIRSGGSTCPPKAMATPPERARRSASASSPTCPARLP